MHPAEEVIKQVVLVVPLEYRKTWCAQSKPQLSHKLFWLKFITISPQSFQLKTIWHWDVYWMNKGQDTKANNIPFSILFSCLTTLRSNPIPLLMAQEGNLPTPLAAQMLRGSLRSTCLYIASARSWWRFSRSLSRVGWWSVWSHTLPRAICEYASFDVVEFCKYKVTRKYEKVLYTY